MRRSVPRRIASPSEHARCLEARRMQVLARHFKRAADAVPPAQRDPVQVGANAPENARPPKDLNTIGPAGMARRGVPRDVTPGRNGAQISRLSRNDSQHKGLGLATGASRIGCGPGHPRPKNVREVLDVRCFRGKRPPSKHTSHPQCPCSTQSQFKMNENGPKVHRS